MLKGIVVYKKPNHYNEGSIPRINTKGLICYDHERRKMHFIFIKQTGIRQKNSCI